MNLVTDFVRAASYGFVTALTILFVVDVVLNKIDERHYGSTQCIDYDHEFDPSIQQ
jgi:hypothetical protein